MIVPASRALVERRPLDCAYLKGGASRRVSRLLKAKA